MLENDFIRVDLQDLNDRFDMQHTHPAIRTDVRAGVGADTVLGGLGSDHLFGQDGDDTLRGRDGADMLSGGAGTDTADYSDRLDRVRVTLPGPPPTTPSLSQPPWPAVTGNDGRPGEGDDIDADVENVWGGAGGDDLLGSSADNRISGIWGDDYIEGNVGKDTLLGRAGADALRGGPGDDWIDAQDGEKDWIDCGPGYDRFWADPVDYLGDFAVGRKRGALVVIEGPTSGQFVEAGGGCEDLNPDFPSHSQSRSLEPTRMALDAIEIWRLGSRARPRAEPLLAYLSAKPGGAGGAAAARAAAQYEASPGYRLTLATSDGRVWLPAAADTATDGLEMSRPVTNEREGGRRDQAVDYTLAVLKAAYEDIRRENERLRDARASVTRQLGPLPLSAAIVAGLVTGFAPPGEQPIQHTWMLWAAGGLFAALVVLSIFYSNLKPYRQLRSEKEESLEGSRPPGQIVDRLLNQPHEASSPQVEAEWYRRMIRVEREVRGRSRSKWSEHRLPWGTQSLVNGFDKERTGLVLVQSLFAAVIVFLILARVVT